MIKICNITKLYGKNEAANFALKNTSLEINDGEMVVIMGPSGSGKTTLLNILGCLDVQTDGEFYLNNINISTLNNSELAKIRNQKIGFIFQQFALIPEYTALENVEMPMYYKNIFSTRANKISNKNIKEKALKALSSLNMLEHAKKYPSQLSGGQQQRTAIARALVNNPDIIIADEPTGSLDQKSGSEVIEILKKINSEGKIVIVVTHDEKIASHFQRKIIITDGKIISDNKNIL